MRTAFVRMNPNSDNMVTQRGLNGTTAILCVECGWEGTAVLSDAPWLIFLGHRCRLLTESVSLLD